MRSTGEVMGLDADLGIAYAKSQMAAGGPLPLKGKVFISVSDADKPLIADIARQFVEMGFEILCTGGTASVLEKAGLKVQRVFKLQEGRPNPIDFLKNREIQLVINTPSGQTPRADEVKIRTTAVYTGTPIMTTLSGARAAALGIAALRKSGFGVKTLQGILLMLRQTASLWRRLACIAASFALLAVVIWRLDYRLLIATAARVSLFWWTVGFALFGVACLAAAVRWHLMLKINNQNASLAASINATLAGHFFNTLLFGPAGGDLAKSVFFSRCHGKSNEEVLAASWLDRFAAGLGSILFGGTVAILAIRPGLGTEIQSAPVQLAPNSHPHTDRVDCCMDRLCSLAPMEEPFCRTLD